MYCSKYTVEFVNKLMKEKAFRKHSLHGKTAASFLLKVFMKDATPLTPPSA